jgi:hypothetical protein
MVRSEAFSVMIGTLKEIAKRPPPQSNAPEHALVLGALANAECFGYSKAVEAMEYFDKIVANILDSAKNEVPIDFGGPAIEEEQKKKRGF